MVEPRWPGDVPPPFARLYSAERDLLEEINGVACRHPARSAVEHDLLEVARSIALAIGAVSREVLSVRRRSIRHHYSSEAMPAYERSMRRRGSKPSLPDSASRELLLQAAESLVKDSRNASTSWLQRQLGISYNSAMDLMDQLERLRVVSEADASGRRQPQA